MSGRRDAKFDGRLLVQSSLESRYFESFNFYFAKPVNEIISQSRTPLSILFRDLAYLDNQHESLRRWYTTPESVLRLNNYADFFEEIKKQYYPFVSSHEIMKIMSKRLYRIHKLRQANKTLQPSIDGVERGEGRAHGRRNALPTDNVLKGLNQLSHIIVEYSEDVQPSDHQLNSQMSLQLNPLDRISFESDPHDIYSPDYSSVQINERFSPKVVKLAAFKEKACESYLKLKKDGSSIDDVYKDNIYSKSHKNFMKKDSESTKSRDKLSRDTKRFEITDSRMNATNSGLNAGLDSASNRFHSQLGINKAIEHESRMFNSIKEKFKTMKAEVTSNLLEPHKELNTAFKKKVRHHDEKSRSPMGGEVPKAPSINISDLLVKSQPASKTPKGMNIQNIRLVPKLELNQLNILEEEKSTGSTPLNRSTNRAKSKSVKRRHKKIKTEREGKRLVKNSGLTSKGVVFCDFKLGHIDISGTVQHTDKVQFFSRNKQGLDESISTYIRRILKQKSEDKSKSVKANSNHIANLFYREKMKRLAYEPYATVDEKKSLIPNRDDKTNSSSKFASLKKKPLSTSKQRFFEHSTDAKDKTYRKHNSNTGSQKEGVLLSLSKSKAKIAMPKLNINSDVKNVLYQSIKIDPNLLKSNHSNFASRLHLSHTVRKDTNQRSPDNKSSKEKSSKKKESTVYLTNVKRFANAFDEYSCHPWATPDHESRVRPVSRVVTDRTKSRKKKKSMPKNSSSASLKTAPLTVTGLFKDSALISSRTTKGSSIKPACFRASVKK
jgi:hypothetical protein